jgi:GGDEF domain-containing protein
MTELELALRREHARAVRYREPFSILLVDRAPTPEVLERVRDATRLCDAVHSSPEEGLAVLLPGTALAGALQAASRLAAMLSTLPTAAGDTAIGVATHPSPRVADAAGLLREAGRALRQAKERGGGVTAPSGH